MGWGHSHLFEGSTPLLWKVHSSVEMTKPKLKQMFSYAPVQLTKLHDDVIKWKKFPRYWPFVRWIHWSLVNSLPKASVIGQWEMLSISIMPSPSVMGLSLPPQPWQFTCSMWLQWFPLPVEMIQWHWLKYVTLCHLLTLKWLGHFFENVISFSDAVHLMCNRFIWNWSNPMNV